MLIELNSKINDKSKREKKIADIDWNQSLSAIQSNWKMSKKNYVCVCVCAVHVNSKKIVRSIWCMSTNSSDPLEYWLGAHKKWNRKKLSYQNAANDINKMKLNQFRAYSMQVLMLNAFHRVD